MKPKTNVEFGHQHEDEIQRVILHFRGDVSVYLEAGLRRRRGRVGEEQRENFRHMGQVEDGRDNRLTFAGDQQNENVAQSLEAGDWCQIFCFAKTFLLFLSIFSLLS